MPEDFDDFSGWFPSEEGLEGLEDRDYEFAVEEVEAVAVPEVTGPCGGCTNCASGSTPLGADLTNIEADLDIVEVEFIGDRSSFYVNKSASPMPVGAKVIVEAERGVDLGTVSANGELSRQKRRSRGLVGQPMRDALRVAAEGDLRHLEENRRIEERAVSVFKEKCRKHNLEMKLTGVEYQFDRTRITFYFTAEGRVDFRMLVRDLAGVYRTRIELRQIGARDEARKIGGIGICGREVCCVSWMSQIRRVNLEHARAQNISLNPARLAGSCGRLKCCILFELENYVQALKRFPPLNAKIVTAKGEGFIEKVDLFRESVSLRYQGTGAVETLSLDEIGSYYNGPYQNQQTNN